MKNKNVLPYVIFGVPVVIGLYFVYKAIKNSKPKGKDADIDYDPKNNSNVDVKANGGTTPSVAKLFPLKKGSKGGKVLELQRAMLGYDDTILGKYRDDGDFGTTTETALQTILSKKTADSQDDIDAIVKKANEKKKNSQTQAKEKSTKEARIILANKLLDAIDRNNNLDLYAIHNTQISIIERTSDGREKSRKTEIANVGRKFTPFGSNKQFIDPLGFIELTFANKIFRLSPYGFEVR